jgi:hypothetical protein
MYNTGWDWGGISSPTLTDVTFSGNAAGYGGGMANDGDRGKSSPRLSNVTFTGNSAGYGGAIYNARQRGESSPTLSNVTFSGNAANAGGAIYNTTSGYGSESILTLENCVLWGNRASSGGGIQNDGTLTMRNSILAANNGTGNCLGPVSDNGNNIEDGTACAFIADRGSLSSTNPLLGALADNGGATWTHALLPGSPAIDAGTHPGYIPAPADYPDQRGVPRPQGSADDIGAFESRGFVLTINSGSPQTTSVANTFAAPLQVTVSSAPGEPVGPAGVITVIPPATGAGLSMSAPFTLTTDASGVVSTTATANDIAGSYRVTVTARGVITPAVFSLTNSRAPALPNKLYLPAIGN